MVFVANKRAGARAKVWVRFVPCGSEAVSQDTRESFAKSDKSRIGVMRRERFYQVVCEVGEGGWE